MIQRAKRYGKAAERTSRKLGTDGLSEEERYTSATLLVQRHLQSTTDIGTTRVVKTSQEDCVWSVSIRTQILRLTSTYERSLASLWEGSFLGEP